ncbi:uncharacterized protein [Palaemon carinicauda]|uniref:uncharacterized protein isoform X2 n=1 Tax=Palaemon carinicauda TaxID=392227 RepID=UPI0035B59AC6
MPTQAKQIKLPDLTNAIEAGILTDYNPTSQRYECAVCSKVGFGDVMPHISSPQHKNSAAWEVIYAQNPNRAMLSFLPEIVREAKINDEIEAVDRRVFSYQCKICVGKRPFNGLTPLQSHLSGGDHHKNKRASNITMQMQNDSSPRPNYSTSTPRGHQRSSPSEYIPTDYSPKGSVIEGGAKSKHNLSWPPKTLPDSLQPPSSSRGSPAGGAFPQRTSPTSYSQDEGLPQEVVNALQSGTVVEKEKTSSWTSYMCKACNVPLTGLKPLMQHLDSIKHLKRITGPQMSSSSTPGHSNESSGPNTQDFSPAYSLSPSAIEALKTGVVEELDSGYLCKACNVPLTGPMPLSQHAESEKHRKKAGVDFPRSMARLQIQDASDSRVKDRNEQQTYQWPSLEVRGASNAQVHLQRGIQKVQTVSDSEIIDYRQYQGQQSQELDGRLYFKWNVISAKCVQFSQDVYRNSSRGGVFIFNYLFLRTVNERQGGRADSQNLRTLFIRMGYKVWLFEELSKKETLEKLRMIQSHPQLRDFDSFICVILSHGKTDTLFTTTDGDLDLDDIRYHFTDSACPSLKDKPKIFLVNFCRGTVKEITRKIEHDGVSPEELEAPQDMCTIYASIRNFKAMRDPEVGTLFVLALCEVFSENAHDTDLNSLYNKLCDTMKKKDGTTPEKQEYGFRKKFYFNPYNVENNF